MISGHRRGLSIVIHDNYLKDTTMIENIYDLMSHVTLLAKTCHGLEELKDKLCLSFQEEESIYDFYIPYYIPDKEIVTFYVHLEDAQITYFVTITFYGTSFVVTLEEIGLSFTTEVTLD